MAGKVTSGQTISYVPESQAKAGDRIIVESEAVARPARIGEILEVVASRAGLSFEVRWEDGHRSSIRPAAGSARFERRS
ncbi:MAG TPA: DUF1918 domain-containing protein [Candidatus Limnocylindrales bacterium]|nr:DUF1918 domain-containing protein [Candidatus Limnocylindrales bacterium]